MLTQSNRQPTIKITKLENPKPSNNGLSQHEYSLTEISQQARILPLLKNITNSTEPSMKLVEAAYATQLKMDVRNKGIALDILIRESDYSADCNYEDAMAYFSVIKIFSAVVVNHYNHSAFDAFTNVDIESYRDLTVKTLEAMLTTTLLHMRAKLDDCWQIHARNNNQIQSNKSSYENEKLIKKSYGDIEAAYQAACQLLAELALFKPCYEMQYRITYVYIEGMIHQSQAFRQRRRAMASKVLEKVDSLEAIVSHLTEQVSRVEMLNLRARVQLFIDNNPSSAMKTATEIDDIMTLQAMDLNFDEKTLGVWVNNNALLKLSIQLAISNGYNNMDLPSLIQCIRIAQTAKDSVALSDETIKAQYFAAVDRIIAHTVEAMNKLATKTRDIDELKELSLNLPALYDLLAVYPLSRPRERISIIAGDTESHKQSVDRLKASIAHQIDELIKEAARNQANFDAYLISVAKYEAEFDAKLSEFETKKKSATPRRLRIMPHPMRPSTSSVAEKQVDVILQGTALPVTLSIAKQAGSYFKALNHKDDIIRFADEVTLEHKAEALLYIADQYAVWGLLTSAITYYKKALKKVSLASDNQEELLKSINMSLEFTRKDLEEQVSVGQRCLDRAKAERAKFILSLGVKALVQQNPGMVFDLRQQSTRDQCNSLGMIVFKQLGEDRRKQGLPTSQKAEIIKNIKARLNIFKGNHEAITQLIVLAKNTEPAVAFPPLTESKAALFAKQTQVVTQESHPAVNKRRRRRG